MLMLPPELLSRASHGEAGASPLLAGHSIYGEGGATAWTLVSGPRGKLLLLLLLLLLLILRNILRFVFVHL
jgi:hypothetical protein